MSLKISMTVNGKSVSGDIEPRTLLVDFIRDTLRLTGTHVGCDTAQCGACTVSMNGKAVKSCSMLAMQAAFKENHGLQCGFCTPGMVMNAIDFAKSHPNPSEQQIREALEGNLCRCTGYHNIVKAIGAGARAMASAK